MAGAKTLDAFLNEIGKLNDKLVSHELETRGITPQSGPVHNKRRQLATILFEEYTEKIPPQIADEKISLDLCINAQFIMACQIDLNNADKQIKQRAIDTLYYLRSKISKIKCKTDYEINTARALLSTMEITFNSMNAPANSSVNQTRSSSSVISIDNETNMQTNRNIDELMAQQFDQFSLRTPVPQERNNFNVNRNIVPQQSPKIYKWKIKFSNEERTMSVFEFIQKVEAKAKVHNVTDNDLFNSASEFFDGFAAKWFYAQTFNNWTELKEKLISDFVQVNYLDNLLDTIRQRKQTYDDTIVQFFTAFEDDCSRLQVQLSVQEKINILKKNVLQKYRPYIALTQFNSTDELKHALKLLEATMPQYKRDESIRSVRFGSRDRSTDRNENNRSANNYRRSRFDRFQSTDSNDGRNNSNNANIGQQTNNYSSFARRDNYRNNRQSTPHNQSHSRERSNDRSKERSASRSQSNERNDNNRNDRYRSFSNNSSKNLNQ